MAEPDLSTNERAELKRLRIEVTELRGQQPHQSGRRRPGWQGPVAILLITLGCILVLVLLLALGLIELIGRSAIGPDMAGHP